MKMRIGGSTGKWITITGCWNNKYDQKKMSIMINLYMLARSWSKSTVVHTVYSAMAS